MYTEKLHAKRLLKMLEMEDSCNHCPITKHFYIVSRYSTANLIKDSLDENNESEEACAICKNFIGLSKNKHCPCDTLGKKKAIEVTIQTLKDKGYM